MRLSIVLYSNHVSILYFYGDICSLTYQPKEQTLTSPLARNTCTLEIFARKAFLYR